MAILTAAILKSKGIICRVRSGNAPYFEEGISYDHWINQYWDEKQSRWIDIDVDSSLSLNEDFDRYDMPEGKFEYPAKAWLDIRAGTTDPERFYNAADFRGKIVVAWSLFYDFHSLMNDECLYQHHPEPVRVQNFSKLTKKQYAEIDALAKRMFDVDINFDKLQYIWETKKEFRLMGGSLL